MSSRKIAKRILRAVAGNPSREVFEALAAVAGTAIAERLPTPEERNAAVDRFTELVRAVAQGDARKALKSEEDPA